MSCLNALCALSNVPGNGEKKPQIENKQRCSRNLLHGFGYTKSLLCNHKHKEPSWYSIHCYLHAYMLSQFNAAALDILSSSPANSEWMPYESSEGLP